MPSQWHEKLSADDKELVLTLADVVGSAHKDAAEKMAASLPPAPRCLVIGDPIRGGCKERIGGA
jgi:hypothetical protein